MEISAGMGYAIVKLIMRQAVRPNFSRPSSRLMRGWRFMQFPSN